jgi:hypothetical protein
VVIRLTIQESPDLSGGLLLTSASTVLSMARRASMGTTNLRTAPSDRTISATPAGRHHDHDHGNHDDGDRSDRGFRISRSIGSQVAAVDHGQRSLDQVGGLSSR